MTAVYYWYFVSADYYLLAWSTL